MGHRVTASGEELNRQIITEGYVFTVDANGETKSVKTRMLWDTGATNSQITREVAEALKLKPLGDKTSSNAGGKKDVAIYKARLYLSGSLHTGNDIYLAECYGGNRFDCVIGMDIISQGTFTISGQGAERTMIFEISD